MTGSIRLFLADDLAAGASVTASAAQAHYLARVMRRQAGGEVRLFNGRDGEWRATIEDSFRGLTRLVAIEQVRRQEPAEDCWLLLPPLRREPTEWAVEKATELGVARVAFATTQRTNPGSPNLARLAAIATEAAEQCERLDVPALVPPVPLERILAEWSRERVLVVAAERSGLPSVQPITGPAALLVGPEGGFAPAELDALRRTPFVVAASLGPRILRAETAAIAGLVLLQARATN